MNRNSICAVFNTVFLSITRVVLILVGLAAGSVSLAQTQSVVCLSKDYLGAIGSRNSFNVLVIGTTAYLIDGGTEIQILDLSDPLSPMPLGGYNPASWISAMRVVRTTAYLVVSNRGLQIVDLSNPASPVLLGQYPHPGFIVNLSANESFVYFTDSSGLNILDVRSPASPVLVGQHPLSGYATSMTLAGSLVYLVESWNGLVIIDVGVPEDPIQFGALSIFHRTSDIHIRDTTAYITSSSHEGLLLVNVITPSQPSFIGSYDTPGSANGITVTGPADSPVAFLADGEAGLIILDVSSNCDTCPADLNADGVLDAGDISAFVNFFLGADLAADLNADGILNLGDISAFITLFLAGC